MWEWLTKTDAGLFSRIGAGAVVFLLLAIADVRRNGRQARRWREYLFLLFSVAVALAYGVVNDLATVKLSPEYFLFGKGLSPVVGENPERLPWEAAKVGLKATWTVGLLTGVAFLMANNPKKDRPQLPYPRLLARMPWVVGFAVACAAVLGAVGYCGWLALASEDFGQMVAHNEFRPYRFMAVFGIHLGGYIGGLLGTMAAVVSIHFARAKERRAE